MFVFVALFIAVFTGSILPETVKSAKFEDIQLPKKVSVVRTENAQKLSERTQTTDTSTATSSDNIATQSSSVEHLSEDEKDKSVAGATTENEPFHDSCADPLSCVKENKEEKQPFRSPTTYSETSVSTTPATASITITPLPTNADPCSPLTLQSKSNKSDSTLISPCLQTF